MISHDEIVIARSKATKEFPLKKAAYFGSYAENKANEESDLDLLVEFDEPAVSILTIIGLKQYLEDILLKSVDVIHAPLPPTAIIKIGKRVEVL